MVARVFDRGWVEHAALRDATSVRLRLLGPGDKDLLRGGFERLSADSRYTRFLVPKVALTAAELAYLTEIDQETHVAIGAVADGPDGEVGLGVARFVRLPGEARPTAEAAVAVADEAQGKGLGRLLFLRLVAAAEERGIERFRCEVLCSNASMKTLIDRIAPERTVAIGDGVMSIDFTLPSVAAGAPPSAEPAGAMYRFFRAAAENAVEWTEAVRRFWRGAPLRPRKP